MNEEILCPCHSWGAIVDDFDDAAPRTEKVLRISSMASAIATAMAGAMTRAMAPAMPPSVRHSLSVDNKRNNKILHPTSHILHPSSPPPFAQRALTNTSYFVHPLVHRTFLCTIPSKSAGCFQNSAQPRLRYHRALARKLDYRQSSIVNRQ